MTRGRLAWTTRSVSISGGGMGREADERGIEGRVAARRRVGRGEDDLGAGDRGGADRGVGQVGEGGDGGEVIGIACADDVERGELCAGARGEQGDAGAVGFGFGCGVRVTLVVPRRPKKRGGEGDRGGAEAEEESSMQHEAMVRPHEQPEKFLQRRGCPGVTVAQPSWPTGPRRTPPVCRERSLIRWKNMGS